MKQIAGEFEGIGSPSWTSNGGSVSFFANNDSGRQLYVWDMKSELVSVALNAESKATRYAWSPDGERIAYFVIEPLESENKNKFNDSFEVGSNDYLVNKPSSITSVWIADSDGSNAIQITPEDFTVATGLTTSAISWSPDGKKVAFTKFPTANSGKGCNIQCP